MTQFIGAEDYQPIGETNISFRQIVLEHYRKITQLSCVEFRGGYWTEKQRTSGGATFSESYYVPDSREVFVNSINMLHDLLLPLFDKQMEEEMERLEEEYEKEYEKAQDKKEWKPKKLELKRELFQRLCLLLNRLRYLEGKSFGETT